MQNLQASKFFSLEPNYRNKHTYYRGILTNLSSSYKEIDSNEVHIVLTVQY